MLLLLLLLLLLFKLLENIFLNILIIAKIYLLLLFKSAWKKSSTLINFNQLIKIITFWIEIKGEFNNASKVTQGLI